MELINNKYCIQGIDVKDICNEFGTPLYVYDSDIIHRQVNHFRNAFKQINCKIKYACKANTNLSILKEMLNHGAGLDTVSVPEIKMGLLVGFKAKEIVFTPNCVDFSEIEEAVKLGVNINIENLPNLEKFGTRYGNTVPCFVRLNPGIHAQMNSDKVDWWHKQSKFGISADQIKKVKELEKKYDLHIHGLHIHSSSVIMSPEIFIEGAKSIFNIVKQFKNIKYIDFGGGIKVDVGDNKEVINLNALGEQLNPIFEDFCKEYGTDIELWFEPGRFLICEAGILFAECNMVKENGGTSFVGINSGFNQLIRPMFYNAYHEIVNISNFKGAEKQYTVVGNVCEIDNFAINRTINEVNEKDIIAIKTAGAYGYSMASNYNSRFRPAEILIKNNTAHLIRKRDSFEDLIKNQIVIK
ncbi:MAG: diaminopimelate decarboxylase [Flavobacteriales bacterium]|nr:diaminopimelate decarboxylase [Flavobacteriales bacterium]